MIKVTRFNDSEFWVNAEMIQYVEATPDTVISLANNDKIVVKEKAEQVIDAILEYRRLIYHQQPKTFATKD
jgi:flagellar protein FlbD